MELIVFHTKSEIRRKNFFYAEQKFSVSKAFVDEMTIESLDLLAAMKYNLLATNELFDTTLWGSGYEIGINETFFVELSTLSCKKN